MKFEQIRPRNQEIFWTPGETDRPYGYFVAQTAFALKARELGLAGSVTEALEQFTALPRKIMGNKNPPKAEGGNWMKTADLLKIGPEPADNIELADLLFGAYLKLPDSSIFKPRPFESNNGRQAGAYTHDYDAPASAIRLHFLERHRGEKSEFGTPYMMDRRADMQAMMMLIRRNGYSPEPTIVTSGSWMYNIRSVINVMPESFRESAAPPPILSLRGDSYWGQLVTSDGGCNMERTQTLIERLKDATDLPSLVACMPIPVLFLQAPINDFYNYYGIER